MRYYVVACILSLMLTSCAEKPEPKPKVVKVELTAEQRDKRHRLYRVLEEDYENSTDKLVGRDINDYAELVKLADRITSTKNHQHYVFSFAGVRGKYDAEGSMQSSIWVSNGRIIQVLIGSPAEY